jgi:predicted RNA-binding Zn-ribbon protein involved in translation (DUF1610 family)
MLTCLLSPCCLEAYERETREYVKPHPCPDCGALILMRFDDAPRLVLKCRKCGRVYDRYESDPLPGFPPTCPDCGEPAAQRIEPDDLLDINAYRPESPK